MVARKRSNNHDDFKYMENVLYTNDSSQTLNRVGTCGVVGHENLKVFFMKTLTKRIGKGIMTVILMASATLVAAASDSPTQTGDAERNTKEPLVLRSIMQDLSTDMQRITDGIATENWKRVAEIALNVANHSQPPMQERLRIIQFVGVDVGRFKGYDHQVHKLAITLSEAAGREDGAAVIEAFAQIQNNCLGCHQDFRQSVQEHFYGKP